MREWAAGTELHQASSPPLAQSSSGTRQRGWVKELTGLCAGIVEELIHLANTDCHLILCQVLCSALTRWILRGGEGVLASRWDEGSAKLQTALGTELKF